MDLTLALTHACNLACDYCFAGEKADRPMDAETGRAAIRLAAERCTDGRLGVAFFGGEPLLRWELLLQLADEARAVARARGLRCSLSVTTNGTLLTPERAAALAERRFRVALSIDGARASQDATRRDRGGGSSAERVERALTIALETVRRVTVVSVVDPRNVAFLVEGVEHLVGRGVRNLILNPSWLAAWDDADLAVWEEAYRAIAELWVARHRAGRPFSISTIDRKVELRVRGEPERACGFGRAELAVAPSGRIYPCGRLIGEDPADAAAPARRNQIGDLERGIDARVELPVPGDAACRPDACAGCAHLARCASRCGCGNLETSGCAASPGALLCWHERMSIPIADAAAARLFEERAPSFVGRFYSVAAAMTRATPPREKVRLP